MSLLAANASRLKPEIRLAQAVSQFEADLSDDEKNAFRAYRSQLHQSSPSTEDVMRLTAEIDRQSLRKSGRRRCFGPRMTNFLQAVQQYAAIGDVIVGGSQNLIACSVWTLVRFTLLSIVSFRTYLEKISTLLMVIGRSAPRYQALALLYPRPTLLQSHLAEYFIEAVSLCQRLVRFARKTAIGQLTAALSDADLHAHQSELEVWANAIKEEVYLEMAKTIEDEAKADSRFRILSTKSIESKDLQRKTKRKLRVLDWCSEYYYETAWKQARKIGNATVFSLSSDYQTWRERTDSRSLIYTGKLGAGKSVLLANIVDDLIMFAESTHVTVAHFFCRHDEPESLRPRTILGCMARQLLRQISDYPTIEMLFDMLATESSSVDPTSLLRRAFAPGHKAYFVLDGLDELGHRERTSVISELGKLQDSFVFLLCISMRVEPNSVLELDPAMLGRTTICSIPETNPDIDAFIESELENCVISKKLVLTDPSLILDMRDALLQGAQGMFLWVGLQIETLCMMRTNDEIRHALKTLPKDLPETFYRILKQRERLGKAYQRRILQIIAASRRPLTTEELREALGVRPGDATWNAANLPNDMPQTLSCCGCLIILDEEEQTVRVVHPSVQQFLISGSDTATGIPFTADSAESLMNEIVVTYLNYGVFDTQLSTTIVPQLNASSAMSQIVQSTVDSPWMQNLILRLLKSGRLVDHDIGQTLAEFQKQSRPRTTENFHFLRYAKSHCLQHASQATHSRQVIEDLLLKLFENEMIDLDENIGGIQILLQRAIVRGNQALVGALLRGDDINVDLRFTHDQGVAYGHTPLSLAVESGNAAIVDRLLNQIKADPNKPGTLGWTPLQKAIKLGHGNIARLLARQDGIELDSKVHQGRMSLTLASLRGDAEVIHCLLQADVFDMNARDEEGRTLLALAAMQSNLEMVHYLLRLPIVDVNSKDHLGLSPLHWAARREYPDIVSVLLRTEGIEVDSRTRLGQTPLWYAVESGSLQIVLLLIRVGGADPGAIDHHAETPLQLARRKGHQSIIEFLGTI